MSRDDVESQGVEDSVDSTSSVPLSGNNNNYNNNNNNNKVVKMSPLFLSHTAELYYKQLLALTKPLAAAARTNALDQVNTATAPAI